MENLYDLRYKVNKVRKSCVTSNHYSSFKRFYQLYTIRRDAIIKSQTQIVKKRLINHLIFYLVTGFLSAIVIVISSLIILYKILE